MRAQRTLDLSRLPAFAVSTDEPLFWGQVFLAFIEGTMFSIFIAMYFYIRLSYDMWPPPGIQLPPVAVPAISLVPLVVSALGSYLASEAAKLGQPEVKLGIIPGYVARSACLASSAKGSPCSSYSPAK